MSLKDVLRLQELAWRERDGFPYLHEYDTDLGRRISGPAYGDTPLFSREMDLLSGEKMTVQQTFAGIMSNTHDVISQVPDVFDITEHFETLYEACASAKTVEHMVPGSVENSVVFDRLPVVGPFRIMPGWWQLTSTSALCIGVPAVDPSKFSAWIVSDQTSNPQSSGQSKAAPLFVWATVREGGSLKFSYPPLDGSDAPTWTLSMMAHALFAVMVAMSIMQADPKVVERKARHARRADRKKNQPLPLSWSTVALPGLRYVDKENRWVAKTGDGVAWHMVRGHSRLLKSDRFTNKQGSRVWVRPHAKGDPRHGVVRKRYVIG